jgi:hypothetical protein
MPDAVRRQENPRPDFAESWRLLIDGDLEAMGNQRVGGEQPANPAADDNHLEPLALHRLIPGSEGRAKKNLQKRARFKLSSLAGNTKPPLLARAGENTRSGGG